MSKSKPQQIKGRVPLNGKRIDVSDLPKAPFTELNTRKRAWQHLDRTRYTDDLRPKATARSTIPYHDPER